MDYGNYDKYFEFYNAALHYNHINLKNSVNFNFNIISNSRRYAGNHFKILLIFRPYTNYRWKAI